MVESGERSLTSLMLYSFVFSLASVIVCYIARSFLSEFYWYLCIAVFIFLCSFCAGKFSNDVLVTTCTGVISILSLGAMEALFPFRNSGVIPPMTPFIVASVWGMGSYAFSDDLSSLWKKSFNVKHLGTIGLIILGLCIGGGVIWIVSTNLNEIIFLLDSHPWIPTLIIGILTFVGGVIFGRKRGQRPS